MAVAGLVVIGVGVVMIVAGTIMSVVDWRRQGTQHPGVETETLGLAYTLTALQKLVLALAKHPIGIRLIVLGIVCVIVGGILGGVAGLTT